MLPLKNALREYLSNCFQIFQNKILVVKYIHNNPGEKMRKLLLLIGIFIMTASGVLAAKFPEEVKGYIKDNVPKAEIRFDGVIIFPSNTLYLPLYPSLFSDTKTLSIKRTYPAGLSLSQEPDIVIFNNDFVLMKVLTDGSGKRSVLHLTEPPVEVRTALLPQDMLVPSGLIIPENIKSIIGNLKIDTKGEDIIRVNNEDSFEEFLNKKEPFIHQSLIPELKNKTVFVTTNYSKNIQICEPSNAVPSYSLAQKSIPIDVKAVNDGNFLIVTSYDRPFIDIVSVADSRFIKQIPLGSNPEQILVDEKGEKAYITSPSTSTIFVMDLETMSLCQKIKINGYCEHILLCDDKLFYVDKLHNEIWAIEIKDNYRLKDIGRFPNISALAFSNDKLFIASRTKSRIAIIDYDTLKLEDEFTTVNKPISMLLFENSLYVLGAQNNEIQVIDTKTNSVTQTIKLGTGGYSTGLTKMFGTDFAIITDVKNNYYSILDLRSGKILKSYELNIPIKDVIIADKIRLFE